MKDNKIILKTRQRFKSERYNAFKEENNTITLTSNKIKECNQIIQPKHMYMK